MLEVDLLDDAELLVGDHESQHHDHADQDKEGEQHAGQVADDPDTVSSECYHNLITVSSPGFHNHGESLHYARAFSWLKVPTSPFTLKLPYKYHFQPGEGPQ